MWINRKRLEEIEQEKLRMKKDLKRTLADNRKLVNEKLDYVHRIEAYEQLLGHIALKHGINTMDINMSEMINPLKVNVSETFNEKEKTIEIKWVVTNDKDKRESNTKSC